MTGLISITHALQTSACYLRLGSTRTEVEQGRPLSWGICRVGASLLLEPPQGRNRPAGRSGRSLLTPRTTSDFRFLCFSLSAADAPTPIPRGLSPALHQKHPLVTTSGPQTSATRRRTQLEYLTQRDTGHVSPASNKSFGTFRQSAIFASQLLKPECPN